MRTIYRTPEFDEFLNDADEQLKKKIAYIFEIIGSMPVINAKIAKKLINTELYEIRIQINNEYRVITYTIDHEDINQCKNVLLISGFMKKSTKDYDKEIKKAIKILEQWKE